MPKPKPFKNYISYATLLLVFGVGIWLLLAAGNRLHSQPTAVEVPSITPAPSSPPPSDSVVVFARKVFGENLRNSLTILLLQIVVIIIVSRLAGKLFRKFGQPPVMGEIVAGIALGPSLLGMLSPGIMTFLFPPSSMQALQLLSQIGVALFMFVVGTELDVHQLREKAHTAILVSHASIIVPFFMGVGLALWLYQMLAPPRTSFTSFALFMGIAMSITAFPVLARILADRGMSQTYLGNIALTCAAVDDVTAWCILAMVVAVARSTGLQTFVFTLVAALTFIAVMLFVIKPVLARLTNSYLASHASKEPSRGFTAAILAFVLCCSLATEAIGIHALFGAFLAGVVMPADAKLRLFLTERLTGFSSIALLPLFFAFTGLRMQIGLLNDSQSWMICGVIVLVAIAGKLTSSSLMARWTGMNWRDSFSLGVLLNTRGLVELIVLNIGYDLGILSAQAFAMLVLMALITTFMTGPLLSLVKKGVGVRV